LLSSELTIPMRESTTLTARLRKLNQRQSEWVDLAVQAHETKDRVTIMAATGTGKSFVMWKYLYAIRERIPKTRPKVFIFSEIDGEVAGSLMLTEAEKFTKIFKKDPRKDFYLKFVTYQSMPTEERDVDIYDEVDKALTEVFSKNIINSPSQFGLGLTGTVENVATVYLGKVDPDLHGNIRQSDDLTAKGEITDFINKGQLMEIICPCVSIYTLDQGVQEGLLSNYELIKVNHTLDAVIRDTKIWAKSKALSSEFQAYHTWKSHIQNCRTKGRVQAAKATGRKMAAFLWECESKAVHAKQLMDKILAEGGRVIIFGERINQLKKITPNVAMKENTNDLIEAFNSGKIDVIATAKKLERRVTLEGVTHGIFVGFTSSSSSFVQRLGRLVRYLEGKTGKIYVLVTEGTLEEKWYNEMRKIRDEKGQIKYTIE
jgi:superfamily II DNA or RNA helicase